MSDRWSFGDIKLPTPYQMRRHIEDRRTPKRGFRLWLKQTFCGHWALDSVLDADFEPTKQTCLRCGKRLL